MVDFVAGVDGCPAGWISVIHPVGAAQDAELKFFPHFAEILDHQPQIQIIAVDIPIGLSQIASTGGRTADRLARANLGDRQSAVFSVPSRSAVACEHYRDACEAALQTSDPPRKVSKQTFNLFPKIREVDNLMSPELQNRVFECHPEVAFWALNGEVSLAMAKKVKSRPNPPGLQYRVSLLTDAGYSDDLLTSNPFPKSKVGPDDILDACAAAWSAERILAGTARCFPVQPEYDARGLRMEIWG
ncbi:MAG: DUF429 domain-containing protein [Pseudomonadota bacterium]